MGNTLHLDTLHLVGLTGNGCRIARDGGGGYVVNPSADQDNWQRVANLPAAYAVCERFDSRASLALPRWREQA
ncbi:MAG: hypothetical protein EBX49_05205 [Synechococcaceae bacterium WB8_1B_136]|nr:hypothetical protein [Synechococcaceae bacterium WB8_1B_136]